MFINKTIKEIVKNLDISHLQKDKEEYGNCYSFATRVVRRFIYLNYEIIVDSIYYSFSHNSSIVLKKDNKEISMSKREKGFLDKKVQEIISHSKE